MPSTLKEHLIFTFLMVFCMCIVMINYNVILHDGFSIESIKKALVLFPITFVVAFICEWFIVGRVAMKLVPKVLKETDPLLKKILITAFIFVTGMASLMSLYGVLITEGYTSNLFSTWIKNISLNFPMAYFLQVAIAGPLVRFIFGKLCPVPIENK
jgi:hypothetical protein